jgi:hypothetical protein
MLGQAEAVITSRSGLGTPRWPAQRERLGVADGRRDPGRPPQSDSLPPLGDLIADEPFWRYPAGAAWAGVAHLRVWLTADPEPGHLTGGH